MWSRRVFAKRLAGALAEGDSGPLATMPGMISAAYIVRRNGDVRRHAEGQALLSGGRWAAFSDDQPFRVASISKMVTATGFMALVSQGRAALDADVSTYFGETLRHPAFADTPITPRMLMSHTSGLRNGDDFPAPFNRSLLARFNAAATEERYGGWFAPAHEPPGWFNYSDTNYAVVAQIIERITGQRFDRYMRATLFDRLNLDIGYNWSGVSQRKRDRAAAACRWDDGAWTPQVDGSPPRAPGIAFYRGENNAGSTEADYSVGLNGFAFAPHGGLRLSLADMDMLARFYLSGAQQGEGDVAAMCASQWTFDPNATNGNTERGWYQRFGLGVHLLLARDAPGASPGDAFFGANTQDWRGHFGDAYGWITGLFWNAHENATLTYVINGMPETNRTPGARSAMSMQEEALVDAALTALP